MIQQHTPGEVQQYDQFKLIVFLALLATLLCLLIGLAGYFSAPPVPTAIPVLTETPSVTPPTTVSITPTQATVTPTVEPTAIPLTASPTPTAVVTPSPEVVTLTLILATGKSAWPSGELDLYGAGPIGAAVEALDNGVIIGTATVDATGAWHVAYRPRNGDHDFSARLAGAAEALTPIESTVTNLTTRPGDRGKLLCVGARGTDLGDVFIVGRCDVLSIIATRTHIDFAALLAANPQVHDPNVIYPGQVITLPRK